MRRALAACAALACAACALGSAQVSSEGAAPCAQNAECASGNVCFLGECRGKSSRLGLVQVEVRAPNDTSYGTLQQRDLDLRRSVLNDFQLSGSAVTGYVLQQQDAVGGATPPPVPVVAATVSLSATDALIPGRGLESDVKTGQNGEFSALASASAQALPWQIFVSPPDGSNEPPLLVAQTHPFGGPSLELLLPAPGALLLRAGTVSAGGAPLQGASVRAVDALTEGRPISQSATTDATGAFQLTLPPAPPPYWLRVGGPAHPGIAAPAAIPSFATIGPFGPSDTPGASFAALPAPAAVTGTVVSASGAPVAGALVNALSTDPTSWVLSASAQTDANGAFSLSLRAGNYVLEAAPGAGPSDPALSGEVAVVAAPGATLAPIVCPPRVAAQGTLLRSDGGNAGAGTQITATRMPDRLVSRRNALVTPTDGAGRYTISGDAGDYRVEFVPPPTSGLPRKVVSFTLAAQAGTQALPAVALSSALEAVGTVTGPAPALLAVPGAVVDFFALDASGTHAVRIGSGVADASGHYRAVLPDVIDPAQ